MKDSKCTSKGLNLFWNPAYCSLLLLPASVESSPEKNKQLTFCKRFIEIKMQGLISQFCKGMHAHIYEIRIFKCNKFTASQL